MSDIHALSGAYAIEALDDLERARFERHLADCPECRAEVDSLREAAATLPETLVATPPPGLRDRVLADIATVRPLPPLTVTDAGGSPTRRRFRPALLVAAAAAVIAVAGGVVWQPWDDSTSQSPSPVDQVLQAADAEQYTRTFPDGSRAILTRSESLNRAVLETKDMAPPPEGHVYELWLQHEEVGMVPAGLMPVDPDVVVLLEGDPATAVAAGITVEPAGGSEEPTTDPIVVIPFEKA